MLAEPQGPGVRVRPVRQFVGRTVGRDQRASGGAACGDGPKYQIIYDPEWRLVTLYRADYNNPYDLDQYAREQRVHNFAGLNGMGGSSHIDSLVFRDRDDTTAITAQADSTMETRVYYGQNWRSDVAAVIDDDGYRLDVVRHLQCYSDRDMYARRKHESWQL